MRDGFFDGSLSEFRFDHWVGGAKNRSKPRIRSRLSTEITHATIPWPDQGSA